MEIVSQNTLLKILLPKWAFNIPLFNLRELGLGFKEFEGYIMEVTNATTMNISDALHRIVLT